MENINVINLSPNTKYFNCEINNEIKHKVKYPLHRRFKTENNQLLITGINICNNIKTKICNKNKCPNLLPLKRDKSIGKDKIYNLNELFNFNNGTKNNYLHTSDEINLKQELKLNVVNIIDKEKKVNSYRNVYSNNSVKTKKMIKSNDVFPKVLYAKNFYFLSNKKEMKKLDKRKQFINQKLSSAFDKLKYKIVMY